ncbi:MAG: hypothetical protein IT389_04865 [Nitrospira sp.]|nr:hypothetical protein [Nitrospira sp.]
MRADKKTPLKADKKVPPRGHKRGVIGYSKKSALLEDAITQMNAGKYGRSSAALKELLALDPSNMEARRLFATLHLRLGSRLPARQAFESLANEALERQDYWLAESLLREYLAAGPRCVPFIEKLGAVYQEKGDALAASEEFAKAIDILVEDPDPDRPALPAELYAKIRELAPASPPAFRLASLFDAQTGELIVRPSPAPISNQDEASTLSAAVESLELLAANLSIMPADPVSGVMPWDDLSANPSELPARSSSPETPDHLVSSSAALLEPSGELSVVPLAPPPVEESLTAQAAFTEQVPVELNFSPSLPISSSESSSLIALHDTEPTNRSLIHEETLGEASVAPASEQGAASLPMPQDLESVIANEGACVAEGVQVSQSDAPSMLGGATSDVLSAPLPWEQVQEATVAIPQSDEESLSVTAQDAEGASVPTPEILPVNEIVSELSEEKREEEPSLLTETGTTLSLVTTEECSPDVAWSAPDVAAIEPASSNSPLPEPSQAVPSLEEQLSDRPAEFVRLPMPWEQVQESSIGIEGFTQESIALVATTPEPLPAQLQEAVLAEASDQGTSEAIEGIETPPELSGLASNEALSVPADEVVSLPESLPAPAPSPEIGKFSWASIFNSAWTFGSSSPAPHDSLAHASPIDPPVPTESVLPQDLASTSALPEELAVGVAFDVVEEPAPVLSPMPWEHIQETPPVSTSSAEGVLIREAESLGERSVASVEIAGEAAAQNATVATPVFQGEQTTSVIADEGLEARPVSAGLAMSDVSLMPWDHIQETPVATPSPEMALQSVVEPPAEAPAELAVPVDIPVQEVVQDVARVMAVDEASAASATVHIEEIPPIEVDPDKPEEPSFRFLDSVNAEVNAHLAEAGTQSNDTTLLGDTPVETSPVVSPVPVGGDSPTRSDDFHIVQQAEPESIASEPVALELIGEAEPVVSVEPASVASVSAEPPPPILPHELLPVLQTLVDQLSMVTKPAPAISAESKSSEGVSRDRGLGLEAASLQESSTAPISTELAANFSSAQTSLVEESSRSQGKTGEVAAHTHHSLIEKQEPSIEPASEAPVVIPPIDDSLAVPTGIASQLESTVVEIAMPVPPAAQDKEEWVRTSETIRFIDRKMTEPVHLPPPPPEVQEEWPAGSPALSPAASAVDVLFQSSGTQARTQTIERTAVPKPRLRLSARLSRARMSLSLFIGSCFSTTHTLVTSIVGLAVLSVAIVAMAIGAVGLTWLAMEEKPSPAFQSLTTPPQRALTDSSKNGYLLLLGFEAAATADPVQAGYERKSDAKDGEMAAVCQGGDEGMTRANRTNASASVAQGWYRSADPAGQFTAQANSLKGWTNQATAPLGRYRQWLKMPFEDWGHGQAVTPPCAAILFAHRLHVAEGFSPGGSTEAGVERLEGDMEAWRTTLGQAKTLPVKMLALQALNDDIAVASGLLVNPDFDGKALPRISKMLRPLDPVESSMRWPMQSQLALAAKSYESQLDADRGDEVPLHVRVAGMLPLPKQRRFNDYAEYYESSYKAAGEGRYSAMPKRSTYIKYPAAGVMDYVTNPVENIIGIAPLPAWDHYNGLVIDLDARLRLASLQAWLRRGPQDADLLARIAKAGQRFYDPYTGLPMLVNLKRGVMYSVGHDGKDQDADPEQDVVVSIPANQPAAVIAKPASKSK